MFEWLRKGKAAAPARDVVDVVWVSDAARVKGMAARARALCGDGMAVLVVAPTLAALERIASLTDDLLPARCTSAFERDALRRALARRGAVSIAHASALSGEVPPLATTDVPLEVLVHGRGDRRATDEAVLAWVSAVAPHAAFRFHLALDDALLAPHAGTIKSLLVKLEVGEDEPIESPLVSRAVANLQK